MTDSRNQGTVALPFKPKEKIILAVQFDGTEKSAVGVTTWLFNKGYSAYYQKLFGPIVDRDGEEATELKEEIVLRVERTLSVINDHDWVYVREGELHITPDEEFKKLFTLIPSDQEDTNV